MIIGKIKEREEKSGIFRKKLYVWLYPKHNLGIVTVNIGGKIMQDIEKKIALLSEQLVELKRAVSGEQSLIINGFDSVHNENKEIKEQLALVEQKLNKLIGDVSLVNEQGKLKKDYKDYTDDEILEIRNKLSLNKAANFLHCSKTTIQRICNRARAKQNKIQFDDDAFVDF